jgi:hypothetical protein
VLRHSLSLAIKVILHSKYGGFGVEMMAAGEPFACYVRESDMKFVHRAVRDTVDCYTHQPIRYFSWFHLYADYGNAEGGKFVR